MLKPGVVSRVLVLGGVVLLGACAGEDPRVVRAAKARRAVEAVAQQVRTAPRARLPPDDGMRRNSRSVS